MYSEPFYSSSNPNLSNRMNSDPNFNPNFDPNTNPNVKQIILPKFPSFPNVPNFNPGFANPGLANPKFSDFNPDFSEKINVESDSINLALSVLEMSKNEYNSMNIDELKTMRRIDASCTQIYALNILIHYKKNKPFLPFTTH